MTFSHACAAGEWWVEVLRFYSCKDLRELAKTSGQPVHLPPDFQLSYELVRGLQHEHLPLRQVQGEQPHAVNAVQSGKA